MKIQIEFEEPVLGTVLATLNERNAALIVRLQGIESTPYQASSYGNAVRGYLKCEQAYIVEAMDTIIKTLDEKKSYLTKLQ